MLPQLKPRSPNRSPPGSSAPMPRSVSFNALLRAPVRLWQQPPRQQPVRRLGQGAAGGGAAA